MYILIVLIQLNACLLFSPVCLYFWNCVKSEIFSLVLLVLLSLSMNIISMNGSLSRFIIALKILKHTLRFFLFHSKDLLFNDHVFSIGNVSIDCIVWYVFCIYLLTRETHLIIIMKLWLYLFKDDVNVDSVFMPYSGCKL